MPKKKIKEETEEKEESDSEEEVEDKDESELEEEVEEAEEEMQGQNISSFISQGKISAPVLEQIANVQPTPDIDWQLSPERKKEKKEEKVDYQLEDQVSQDYETPRQNTGFSTPTLKTERVDTTTFGKGREKVGREFQMQQSFQPKRDDEYATTLNVTAIDRTELGKGREEIGRKYKPKH